MSGCLPLAETQALGENLDMQNYEAKDVEAYIKSAAKESRGKLEELRALITSTIP